MFKFFNKLLEKSNSYNYYKDNLEYYKNELNKSKSEKIELKKIYENILNEDNDNKIKFQRSIDIMSINLKTLHNNQLNIEKKLQTNIQNIQNEIYTNRILQNVASIKQDANNGRIINIVFLINFRNAVFDKIINLFEKDPVFKPTVLILPYDLHNSDIFDKGLNKHQLIEYDDNYEYFNNQGFNVVRGYNPELKSLIDIESEIKPDILFYHTPWHEAFPNEYKIENLSNNILFCYIPYGIHASYIVEGQFNRELQNKAWKIFYQTRIHKDLAIKYSDRGSSNVVLTGSPKMDKLIDGSHEKNPYPWKDSLHKKKRVIWAPHHSINLGINFSTFDKNYEFFYDFAKKHSEIEWVFKPHPNLRHYYLISEDIRFSDDNLEKYYKSWSSLPNATIYERGDYQNMFATSDTMITDSVSFLSEYLFSGNPGLFLTNSKQKFNEYGDIIKNAWYHIDGSDFEQIEIFINNVVINEKDPLKSIREDIYNKYLKTNSISPSEKIYNYIKRSLT